MNARIDHRICWRVIGLMLFSALLSVTAPAFSCTAYAVEEGADNGVVERDSTGGPGALVGAVALKTPAIVPAKQRKIRAYRLSIAMTRRLQNNYLDGNGTVCPGITI